MKKILILPYSYKDQAIENLYLVENFETKSYDLKEVSADEGFTNSYDLVTKMFNLAENDLARLDYLDTIFSCGVDYEIYSVDVSNFDVQALISLQVVQVPAYMIRRISDAKVLAVFLKMFLNLAESTTIQK